MTEEKGIDVSQPEIKKGKPLDFPGESPLSDSRKNTIFFGRRHPTSDLRLPTSDRLNEEKKKTGRLKHPRMISSKDARTKGRH